jgi:peptide/nickel transport system substrate-binding protein
LAVAAAVLAMSGTAVAAPQHAQRAAAATPTKLVVALTQDIDSLNPFISITVAGTQIGREMYEFLTTYSQKDESPVPALASKWTTSADRLTWTYTIRSGAKWSDGVPITAKDVAFTYNLMMTNPVAATANGNFTQNFASVTAPNDTTVVIRTKSPQASMLALDIPIVPQHVWSKVSNIHDYPNLPGGGQPVVSSGPFLLSDYKAGQYAKLVANPTYWRGRPKIDELDFVHFDNTDAAVQALKKGDVDLVQNLSPAQFNALQGQPDITTNKAEGARFTELLMNPGAATNSGEAIGDGNPALKDVAFRRAVAQAIDVNTLVKQVYGGYAQPGTGYIPARFTTYHWDPAPGQAREFDLDAAGKALTAAGYPLVNGQRMGKDGKPVTLRVYGESDRVQDAQELQYIAGWLKQLGLGVTTQIMSSDKIDEVDSAGLYDLALSTWTTNPDPDYVLSIQTCSQRPDAQGQTGTTDDFFCDPQYDQLYQQSVSAPDTATRATIVKQMQQVLYQQAPMVTLVYANALEAYRSDKFAPFAVQPDPGGVIFGQNGYWSYLYATPLASAGGSSSTPVIVVVVVVVVVVLGLVLFFVSRRRRVRTADDRE